MHREQGQIRLEEIVESDNVCLPVEATFRQLLGKMHDNDKGVVVILKDDRTAGIITERDVVQMMYHNVKLDDGIYFHAQKKLIHTNGKRCINYALSLMLENNIRRLIVTRDDGSFQGVVTQRDLLGHMEEVFDQTAIKIRHVMAYQPDLVSVEKSVAIRDVLHLFMLHKISSVPVLEEGVAVGIITEKDILRLASDEVSMSEPVSNYMSFPVFTTDGEASVVEIVHEMNMRNIRRVVVNSDAGNATGILTGRDFARNLEGDYNHFLELKLKYTKEILNLLPEMLIELVDLGEGQLVIWANEKALSNFGTSFLDKPVTELIPVDRWQEIYMYLCDNEKVADVRFEKDGNIYEFSGYYLPIEKSDEKGRIQLIIRDITEEVILATVDPLTNIFNRRHITDILVKETDRSKRFSSTFSIVMIDIDDFKQVNDQHGHIIGDMVLKAFARGVKEKLRQYDVLGRYGGEEFLLILPELGSDETFEVVDRIRSHIEHLAIEIENGLTLQVTSSFGVASFPTDAETSMDLLIKADEKLYNAKRTGKNKVVV
jgi:diguanylate cyclase (GGDEF)-like protein